MKHLTWLAVASSIGTASPAYSDNITTFATLTGKCTRVMAMDVVSSPALCADKVTNVEYPNGRIGFIYLLAKKGESKPVVISFFGDGRNQLHIDQDTAMQPIDRVHFTFQGSTDDLVAAGSCRFSNPYSGKPSKISCSADSNQGKFVGEFISNGTSPNMSQSR